MKIIILGNAGAGKTRLAKSLIGNKNTPLLSLDEITWSESAIRKPLTESLEELESFILTHQSWIVEGCYSDLIEAILDRCERLIFLNPGIEVCIAHSRSRVWESEKFDTRQAQEANLPNLIGWIREYETRTDEYGLIRHRQLFDSFIGDKIEYCNPDRYGGVDYNNN